MGAGPDNCSHKELNPVTYSQVGAGPDTYNHEESNQDTYIHVEHGLVTYSQVGTTSTWNMVRSPTAK